MTCNDGQRKILVDALVESVTDLLKKHGLEDITMQRETDPVLLAVRGCLLDENGKKGGERIELVLQVSPDLARAEKLSLSGTRVEATAPADVLRAYDLSEVVAHNTVAKASSAQDDSC